MASARQTSRKPFSSVRAGRPCKVGNRLQCRARASVEAESGAASAWDRRGLLAGLPVAALTAALWPAPSAAATATAAPYTDEQDAFSVTPPEGWKLIIPQEPYDRFRSGVSSRRTLVWLDPSRGTEVNVTVIVTTPGADYTSLSSFGSASDFGANLVSSMDRSYMLRKGQPPGPEVMVSRLVSTSTSADSYFVEYTTKRGQDAQKHFYSRIALGTNGRYRRFYTITACCPEDDRETFEPLLKRAVNSLKIERLA